MEKKLGKSMVATGIVGVTIANVSEKKKNINNRLNRGARSVSSSFFYKTLKGNDRKCLTLENSRV